MHIFLRMLAPVIALGAATNAGGAPRIEAAVPAPDAAPIAFLVDVSSGQILMEREADRRFVPASITKVMTLYLAFELIEARKLQLAQTFTVRPETFKEWHNKGSRMFVPKDARISVDDLLMGIAAVSANDGSIILAEGAAGSVDGWVALMNRKARDLGMNNSHFGTPNGWMDEGRTFTTARDLTTLARAIITRHPSKYARYFGREGFKYNNIAQANHDPMIGVVDGADGLKTGFTNEAGYGFLGSAKRNGRRLIMVIAASERPQFRNKAARELIEWGFSAHDIKPLFYKGNEVGFAEVQDGASGRVALLAPGTINATFPAGAPRNVRLTIHYEGPLQAPVAKGERIAELEIQVDGLPPSRVPLMTADDVPKAGTFQRLYNGIAGLIS